MPNAIIIIHPYRFEGTWVFNDDRHGLVREPFVLGAGEMIDAIVAKVGIAHAATGFRLLFSAQPIPGHHAKLLWECEDTGGNWYRLAEGSMHGWLCPALFHYFDKVPRRIYCRVEELSERLVPPPADTARKAPHQSEVQDLGPIDAAIGE